MMKREIKFRAWNNVKKVMEAVVDIEWTDNSGNTIESICTKSFKIKQPNFDLMQYTGLKDKNGKEIYEGDIVKTGKYGDNNIHEIKWNVNDLCISLDYSSQPLGTLLSIDFEFEVIGNIHENPELI